MKNKIKKANAQRKSTAEMWKKFKFESVEV